MANPLRAKKYPGTQPHIHKYEYRTSKSSKFKPVWTCALPACYHYLPTHMEHMIQDRLSLCHNCDTEITLFDEIIDDAMKNPLQPSTRNRDIITYRPLCDKCAGRIVPNSIASIEADDEYSRSKMDEMERLSRIGTTESMNKWCDDCQMNHKEGEHVS